VRQDHFTEAALPTSLLCVARRPDVIARVRADPRGFLDELVTPAILDEIQNTPELLNYIRSRIDNSPTRRGQWLLTGSQEAPLMQGVAESMAGRATVLQLLPLSTMESLQVALWLSGRFEESVAIGELALALSGRDPKAMGALALTLADWGKAGEADAIYYEMQARARRQYVPPALLAVAASAAAREDEAVRHAFEAYEVRDPNCQNWFSRYSPSAARLYRYARFRELIAQMGRSDWLRAPMPSRSIPGATHAGTTS